MSFPTLAEILGQERAVSALGDALRGDRVHHAWVFHGPSGVGKMTAARAFASALLDPTTSADLGGEIRPDPDSPTQKLLEVGAHPDYTEVTKELAAVSREDQVRRQKQRSIAVDVIREFLTEPATRGAVAPAGPGARARRVFVVDEAHLLSDQAAATLLKTLEEPPIGVVIVLVTDQERDLPATILSRCRRLGFGALDAAAMKAWLRKSKAAEGLEADTRDWLLGFARGSPGAFLQAKESGLAAWREKLGPMLRDATRGKYAPELSATMTALIGECAEAAVKGRPNASKDVANKSAAAQMFSLLSAWASEEIREEIGRGGGGAGRALDAAEAIADAEGQLERNANLQLAMENLCVRLSSAEA